MEKFQTVKKKLEPLRKAIIGGRKKLIQYLKIIFYNLIKWAKKEVKKQKNGTMKKTPLQTIKELA